MIAITDYNGVWICSGQDNMEALLSAVGVSWMKRKAASAMGYGAGKLVQTVEQDGMNIFISNKGGQRDFDNEIHIGTTQKLDTADGDVVETTSGLDKEGNLVLQTKMLGKDVTIIRKRISEDTTHLVIIHKDVTAIRIFKKK